MAQITVFIPHNTASVLHHNTIHGFFLYQSTAYPDVSIESSSVSENKNLLIQYNIEFV